MSVRKEDDIVERDNFIDKNDRKKEKLNRRKDHRKLDHPGSDKRMKRVGSDNGRWKFDPSKYDGEDDDYREEEG